MPLLYLNLIIPPFASSSLSSTTCMELLLYLALLIFDFGSLKSVKQAECRTSCEGFSDRSSQRNGIAARRCVRWKGRTGLKNIAFFRIIDTIIIQIMFIF